MRRIVSSGPAVLVLAAVMLVLGFGPGLIKRVQLSGIEASVRVAQARLDDGSNVLEAINRANRAVADAVLPGIVHIQVRSRSGDGENGPRFGGRASAAGWFYNEEGFIVTNAHVVADATTIRVETFDGRVREASVIGADPRTDIAVIRADGLDGLTPLRRASGEPVFVGERVFAAGSPFGIKFSMSEGIVSGLGRSEAASLVGMSAGYTNFIQTDAAMNPGNSGGPLVDVRGRVVGMSTAIANNVEFSFDDRSPQGQSAGIGFAIPIETIESVASQLISSKVVIRGHLGIGLRDYPGRFGTRTNDSYDGSGALLTDVIAGRPADRAGLRAGDIVVEVRGQPCSNADVLRSIVSIREPGSVVPMKVWREGEIVSVDVAIGAAYFDEDDLVYIPGSEAMTLEQVRARVRGPAGEERVD